ncbi:MAG: DNA cytosine methyltransferase [Fibrobacteraceae bacterium]|nr:DNA cytosine methyltransferase [Fibrobacteraceae bacterium]
MAAEGKVNLEKQLRKILGDIRFDEDLATLSHYLSLQDTPQSSCYSTILENNGVDLNSLPSKVEYLKKYAKYPPKKKTKFSFIDLFAGIGGFRLAMQEHGGECVFTSEWDAAAKQTYSANYADIPFGDITKIEPKFIPDFDILTGGFPCQPFSSIGKREGFEHKTQGTLFFYIAKIIKDKQPKAFLLENVPGLVTHNDGKTFEIIQDTLKNELNYDVFTKVLNSADYKVPQERKRLYIVGFRKDLEIDDFHFPKPNGEKIGIGQFVEVDAEGPSISKHLQQTYIFKKDDGHPEIIDSTSDFPVKTLCASYHKIQRITGTFVKGGKTGLRLLTERECKAIMGYPMDFEIPVSRTQMYHQFGNSVAVPVVTAISKKIIEALGV